MQPSSSHIQSLLQKLLCPHRSLTIFVILPYSVEHENFRKNCTTSPYLEHCDRLRSLASSGTGRLWDLSRLEKYCGKFEQEEVSESQKKIEDLSDFAADPQI